MNLRETFGRVFSELAPAKERPLKGDPFASWFSNGAKTAVEETLGRSDLLVDASPGKGIGRRCHG